MPERPEPTDRARPFGRPDAIMPRPADEAAQTEADDDQQARTDRLRREIQAWHYDEEAGLEAALDKLAHDLGVELTDARPEQRRDGSNASAHQ